MLARVALLVLWLPLLARLLWLPLLALLLARLLPLLARLLALLPLLVLAINTGKTEKPKQMHHQKNNAETMKPLSTHDDFARFSNFLENSLFVVSFFKMDFRRRPFNQKPLVFTNNSRTHPEAQGSFGGEGTFQECHC